MKDNGKQTKQMRGGWKAARRAARTHKEMTVRGEYVGKKAANRTGKHFSGKS